jgi:4-hydroxymandelate oxidase
MVEYFKEASSRRRFLLWLAGTPLIASPRMSFGSARWSGRLENLFQDRSVIAAAEDAFDVLDFEVAARQKLPPAHFGYLATGVDSDLTIRANQEGFLKYEIRSRRMIDTRHIDLSVRLFGTTWDSPIVICPVGSQKAFNPEGEVAVARAARSKHHLQVLSTVTTSSLEEVVAARGGPVWQQLYPTNDWSVGRAIVKRAETAGCPVLVLTVDLHDNSNRETLFRSKRADDRPCAACHEEGFAGSLRRKPMFDGLDISKARGLFPDDMTWDYVKRLKDTTTMKLVVKGIVTREDAQLAIEHGVDGIIVSNHGGRAEETNRSAIECLPEIVEHTAGKVPVLVDGGIRRGTDIFKALALGATAIGIGRPYVWGLAAFGQPGVETVLDILRRELTTIMRSAGTISVDRITRAFVTDRLR